MLAVLRRNPVALALAILLHIGLAVFLIFEVDWREEVKPIGADVQVVQATLVDQQQLEASAKKKQDEARARAAAAKRAEEEKLAKRRAEEKRKLAEIKKKRETKRKKEEARKKAEEKKRIEAEKVRLAAEKRKAEEKKRKEELQKKRALEEEKRKTEEAARKKVEAEAKAKKEAEARRKAEEKKKAEAERKRKAEAERKRKARAKAEADRKAREAELAAQIAAEQDASELQRVIGLIQEKIERNWLRPPGTEGLKCVLNVRLGASGSVLRVGVVKSSGNIAFDRSVEAAVRKADPLPMPTSKRLLAKFRDLNFKFDPGI